MLQGSVCIAQPIMQAPFRSMARSTHCSSMMIYRVKRTEGHRDPVSFALFGGMVCHFGQTGASGGIFGFVYARAFCPLAILLHR